MKPKIIEAMLANTLRIVISYYIYRANKSFFDSVLL